jgi:hypothetical protein
MEGLRGIAALFLLIAIAFFPMIMNPLIFGFFDAESDAERLAHAEDHLGALRLLFTGIGVTEVALGVTLWIWGRKVAEQTPGPRGNLAGRFAWVALAAGVVALLGWLSAWIDNAEALASDDLSATDIVFGLISGGGFSLSFLVFGYLMIRRAMPTWLGVVWILCGIMFWLGILPLWFFVGALVFGVRGLITFRAGATTLAQISAHPVGE